MHLEKIDHWVLLEITCKNHVSQQRNINKWSASSFHLLKLYYLKTADTITCILSFLKTHPVILFLVRDVFWQNMNLLWLDAGMQPQDLTGTSLSITPGGASGDVLILLLPGRELWVLCSLIGDVTAASQSGSTAWQVERLNMIYPLLLATGGRQRWTITQIAQCFLLEATRVPGQMCCSMLWLGPREGSVQFICRSVQLCCPVAFIKD